MSVAAVVLAAGRSTRMGANKMLADLRGQPLVRRTVEAVLASQARPVLVVAGHEPDGLMEALAGLEIAIVHNARHAEGLATSLIAGVAAVPDDASAALICLGDMPLVEAALIDRLLASFESEPLVSAVVPAHNGEWGNPVLLSRTLFAQISDLSGDAGARKLLRGRTDVAVVAVADESVLLDADTPKALALIKQRIGR